MISILNSSKNNTKKMKGKVIPVEKGKKDEMNGKEALRKRMENWRKTEKILGDIRASLRNGLQTLRRGAPDGVSDRRF